MNGRIYDPYLGRFLSADPFVQSPGNLQNYNRYSYVLNNPLAFTDPSGHFFKTIGKFFKKFWKPIVAIATGIITGGIAFAYWGPALGLANGGLWAFAGAVGGFTTGFVGTALAGGSFGDALLSGFIGGAIGAVTGYASFRFFPNSGGSLSSAQQFAKSMKAAEGGWRAAMGGLVTDVKHIAVNLQFQRWVDKAARHAFNISGMQLNAFLMAASFFGEYVVGSRIDNSAGFASQSEGRAIRGIFSRSRSGFIGERAGDYIRQIIGAPIDVAEIVLGYQGIPTASGLRYAFGSNGGKTVTGESNGAMDVGNLRSLGFVPSGSALQATPAAFAAPSGLMSRINLRDPVSFFGLSKLFNWSASVGSFGTWGNPGNTHLPWRDGWNSIPWGGGQ